MCPSCGSILKERLHRSRSSFDSGHIHSHVEEHESKQKRWQLVIRARSGGFASCFAVLSPWVSNILEEREDRRLYTGENNAKLPWKDQLRLQTY